MSPRCSRWSATIRSTISSTPWCRRRSGFAGRWPCLRAGASAKCSRRLRGLAGMNRVFRSYIGMGYAGCFTPQVVQRNVLENPGWYTAYTPYQAEISQGRLEALLNFQTMVSDLTALPVANASLLDEATAAAEAMSLSLAVSAVKDKPVYLVDEYCHPQTIAVVRTRAEARGIEVVVASPRPSPSSRAFSARWCSIRLPTARSATSAAWRAGPRRRRAGDRGDRPAEPDAPRPARRMGRRHRGRATASASACRWGTAARTPPSSPRATRTSDSCPGRIIGVSRDRDGRPALRMALQTREQHIRRDKATSNVCTAQVLLAVMASMYAVYHGPGGLRRIAERVHSRAVVLANALRRLRYRVVHDEYFDTVCVEVPGVGAAPAARRGPHPDDQPAAPAADSALHRAGRDGDARRPGRYHRRLLAERGAAVHAGGHRGARPSAAIPEIARAHLGLPRPSGVPPAPFRNRDAALHQAARGARPLAHLRDDPARLVHHEAQRDHRDDAGELARVQPAAPLRAARPGHGLRPALPPAGIPARRDHRVRRRVAPAERGFPGRVRRTAGDPRVAPFAGESIAGPPA